MLLLLIGLLCTKPAAFFLLLAALLALREVARYHFKHWKRHNVPFPKTSLYTGNLGPLLTFKQHIGDLVSGWYNEFYNEPFIGYFKVFTPAVMVKDPEVVKNILTKDFASFAKNDFSLDEQQDPLLRHNPFMVTGSRWKRARGLLTPSFTGARMKQLFQTMERVGNDFSDYVGRQLGQDLESKSISTNFATQNTIACTFGIDAECFTKEDNQFRVMGAKIFQPSLVAGLKTLLVLFIPGLMKLVPVPFLTPVVDKWMRKLVKDVTKERQQRKSTHDDFLQMLLNTQDKNNVTDEELTGHVLSFFSEGFETSSGTLGFAMYHLAKTPEVQEKLFQEIERVVSGLEGPLTLDVMQQIDYLDWVFQETLRINPPVPVLQKICTQNYMLRRTIDGKCQATVVWEGTPITIPLHAIHMDPKYHPEPEQFKPERFSPDQQVSHEGTVYFPFGDGPRACLGMRFAQTQVKLALLKIVQKYRIQLSPNHKPIRYDPRSFLYQPVDGLLITFEKR